MSKQRDIIRKLYNSIKIQLQNEGSGNSLMKLKPEINENQYKDTILEAIETKDSDYLEEVLFIGFKLNLFNPKNVVLLHSLLIESWHEEHENILSLVKKHLRSNEAVDSIVDSLSVRIEYLVNDKVNYTRECCFALSYINTSYARQKLNDLSSSDDDTIQRFANQQITRIHVSDHQLNLKPIKNNIINKIFENFFGGAVLTWEELEKEVLENVSEEVFNKSLNLAVERLDGEFLNSVLEAGLILNVFSNEHSSILKSILLEDWHECHEEISKIFVDYISDSDSIDLFVQLIYLDLPYFEDDKEEIIQNSCRFLKKLGSMHAIEQLQELTKSNNEQIKSIANEILNK